MTRIVGLSFSQVCLLLTLFLPVHSSSRGRRAIVRSFDLNTCKGGVFFLRSYSDSVHIQPSLCGYIKKYKFGLTSENGIMIENCRIRMFDDNIVNI